MNDYGVGNSGVIAVVVMIVAIVLLILGCYGYFVYEGRGKRRRDEFLEEMLDQLHDRFWTLSWWHQAIVEQFLSDDLDAFDFFTEPYKAGSELTIGELKRIQQDVTELAKEFEEKTPTDWQKAQREHFQPLYEKLISDLEKHCKSLFFLDEIVALVYIGADDGKYKADYYDYDADALLALIKLVQSAEDREDEARNRFDSPVDLCSEAERERFEKMKQELKKAEEGGYLWYSERQERLVIGGPDDGEGNDNLPEWLQKESA